MSKRSVKSVVALATVPSLVALAVVGCGGGSSSGGGGDIPSGPTARTFTVVNSYVTGTSLFRDLNDDGLLTSGSETAGSPVTNTPGRYSLTFTAPSGTSRSFRLISLDGAIQGRNANNVALVSPDTFTAVTPLTTVLSARLGTGATVTAASVTTGEQAFVRELLGLAPGATIPSGVTLNADPVAQASATNANAAWAQLRDAGASVGAVLRAAVAVNGAGGLNLDAILAASRGVSAFVAQGGTLAAIIADASDLAAWALTGALDPTASAITDALVTTTRNTRAADLSTIAAAGNAARDSAGQATACAITVNPNLFVRTGRTIDFSATAVDSAVFATKPTSGAISLAAGTGFTVNGLVATATTVGAGSLRAGITGNSCTPVTVNITVLGATGTGSGTLLTGTGTGLADVVQ